MLKLAALIAILAPLVGSLVAGLGAAHWPTGAHTVTIIGMVVALFASVWLFSHGDPGADVLWSGLYVGGQWSLPL